NTYNIRVINLSLGRNVFESYTQDPLCQAGLVVVVAAGNNGRNNSLHTNGYEMIGAPGQRPTRTMQTASKNDDRIASFSSKGPSLIDHIVKPDLVAPGNNIASLLSPGSTLDSKHPSGEVSPVSYGGNGKKQYFVLSGTSMATPVLSGAAALLLQQNSALTPDQVKARLMKTADKMLFPAYDQMFEPVSGTTYQFQYDISPWGQAT